MNLSQDLIEEELQKHYEIRRVGPGDARLRLHSIFFYQWGMKLSEDAVYIVRQGQTTVHAGGLMISLEDNDSRGIHILSPVDLFDILNVLQGLFDRYTVWDQHMEAMAASDADIGAMLLESAPLIGNPMSVVNSHMELVGAVGYDASREEPWYRYTIRDIPLEYAGRMRVMEHDENHARETFLYHDENAERVYGVNLIVRDEYSGSLSMMESVMPLTESRKELLKHLKIYIEEAVFHRAYATRIHATPIKTSLSSLLSGGRGYEDQLAESIMQFFSMQDTPASWLVILIQPEAGVKMAVPEYLMSAVNDLLPKTMTFSHEDGIVCLVCEPDRTEVRKALDYMLAPMQRIGMLIGISGLFEKLTDFPAAYRQALSAIETGTAMGHKGEIFAFSQYMFPYMLHQARGVFQVGDLMTAGLKRLEAHDAAREVSYIDTLRSFLEHEMNLSATAKDLYVHRSSLEQRLERIYALLGTRLEGADERLYYRMILKMMKEEERFIL